MIIRQMEPDDLDFALSCTTDVGWASWTRQEIEGLRLRDPAGCFVAEAEGQRIGICVAIGYGECGFVGMFIVARQWRGRGLGSQLFAHAVDYLRGRGVRSVFLDAVPAAIPLYERMGFRKVCRQLRFGGALTGILRPCVRAMQIEDLPEVLALDREAFGADRGFFLRRRLSLYPGLCKVLEQDGQIAGYAMALPAGGSLSVGPWVARPEARRPVGLLEALALEAPEGRLSLGVLEVSTGAVEAMRSLGFDDRQPSPYRMVLGPSAEVGTSRMCYARGSGAKG